MDTAYQFLARNDQATSLFDKHHAEHALSLQEEVEAEVKFEGRSNTVSEAQAGQHTDNTACAACGVWVSERPLRKCMALADYERRPVVSPPK